MPLDSTTNIFRQVLLLVALAGRKLARRQNDSMTKTHPPEMHSKVGHYLREWRKHRGLTLESLGEKVGVTHGALSQLERGEINYTQQTLEAIARALGCNAGELIMGPPDGPPMNRKKRPRLADLMDAARHLSDEQIEGLILLFPSRQETEPASTQDPSRHPKPPSKAPQG